MMRNLISAAGGLLLCGAAAAQGLEGNRVAVTTAPLNDAGIYNVVTKTWRSRSGVPQSSYSSGSTVIYNNTCTRPSTPYAYLITEHCEEMYDEGRIPSTSSPNAPPGAHDDNNITAFTFAYYTAFVTGTVDIRIDFYDNLGGICLGGIQPPVNPPAAGTFDFGAAMGYPLPGAMVQGQLAGWLVTIDLSDPSGGYGASFCLKSDGDGVFDNSQANDLFTWRFQHEMNRALSNNVPSGPVLGGWPSSGAPGSCTYNIACGSDAFGPCGTGLDTSDNIWGQTDGVPPGGIPNVPGCPGASTSGCFFLGYPTQGPFASLFLTLESSGACGACTGTFPTIYCTGKTNSLGCTPAIAAIGTPSASQTSGFKIESAPARNNKPGLLFYGKTGQNNAPFQGGTLCVAAPIKRTPVSYSGGTPQPANDCSGKYSIDFNAYIAAGTDPTLIGGVTIDSQWWGRDPGFPAPDNTALSNGLEFTICP